MAVSGYGTGGYGLGDPWGSVAFAAPPAVRSIGPFSFVCPALSEGFKIRVEWTAPEPADAPEWGRQLRILQKQGEWPQDENDSGAIVVVDDTFPIAGTYSVLRENLTQGQIYYYSVFARRTDGTWAHDKLLDRCSAYPYDRWGACDYMFASLPRGFRSQDVGFDHLFNFICIFGTLVDDIKTDAEHILTLWEIDDIHDDLIFMLDRTIAWPTWFAEGGLVRRKETGRAVELYKLFGRTDAYEATIGQIASWQVNVVEGWRYVFFSNGRYASTTVDFANPDLLRLFGRIADPTKYTNDGLGWHAVHGLGFFLSEIPGVSGPFTGQMLARTLEMIEFSKASFVTTALTMIPVTDEDWDMFRVLDSFFEETTYAAMWDMVDVLETDLGATTDELNLFESNVLLDVTNSLTRRVFHSDLAYV